MKRLDPIQSLRGFFCLVIIWFHLQPPHQWGFLAAPSGTLAVYVFYILSGYAIGYGFFSGRYSLTWKSLKTFYIRRFLRIAPAYYVCILLSIFIFYPQIHVNVYDVVRFFTFTANFDYLNLPFLHLLAIISTEMQFYLVAPILFVIVSFTLRKIHPNVVGAGILFLGSISRYLLLSHGLVTDLPTYMLNVYVTVWGMIDYFLFGMWVSFIAQKKTFSPSIALNAMLAIGFCFISYTNYYGLPFQTYAMYHLFIIPPVLCILIGWYILSSRIQSAFFSFIGKYSYGMYLYHFVFFTLLATTLPLFVARFIIVSLLSLLMAGASLYFIERPLRTHFGATNGVFVKPESRSSTEGEEMAEA